MLSTILIVSDDGDYANPLAASLSQGAICAVICPHAHYSVAIARLLRPVLVIADACLPGASHHSVLQTMDRAGVVETCAVAAPATGDEAEGQELESDYPVFERRSDAEYVRCTILQHLGGARTAPASGVASAESRQGAIPAPPPALASRPKTQTVARAQRHSRPNSHDRVAVVRIGELEINIAGSYVKEGNIVAGLTHRETILLERLIAEGGALLSADELLKGVGGEGEVHWVGGIRNHIASLRRKLSIRTNRQHLIVCARRFGYRFAVERAGDIEVTKR